jgi:hypothetical protein
MAIPKKKKVKKRKVEKTYDSSTPQKMEDSKYRYSDGRMSKSTKKVTTPKKTNSRTVRRANAPERRYETSGANHPGAYTPHKPQMKKIDTKKDNKRRTKVKTKMKIHDSDMRGVGRGYTKAKVTKTNKKTGRVTTTKKGTMQPYKRTKTPKKKK